MASADYDLGVGNTLPALVDWKIEDQPTLHARLPARRAENRTLAPLGLLACGHDTL
jgi:hypothetical protein